MTPTARAVLRDAFGARLAADGWLPIDPAACPTWCFVGLYRPVGTDLAAVVEVKCMARGRKETFPVDIAPIEVGVAYEPLRRRWELLRLASVASVSWRVDHPMGTEADWPVILDHADQVPGAVDELAPMVGPAASEIAGRYRDVKALLEGAHDDLEEVALLAAAEQFDRAAEVLAARRPEYSPSPRRKRERDATAAQLARWISARDDAGLEPLPPPEPPAEPSQAWMLAQRTRVIARYLRRHYFG